MWKQLSMWKHASAHNLLIVKDDFIVPFSNVHVYVFSITGILNINNIIAVLFYLL